MIFEERKIKEWFEQNYLDGDKIQDGQMLSSSECFNAVSTALCEYKEELLGKIENMAIEVVGNSAKIQDQIIQIIKES